MTDVVVTEGMATAFERDVAGMPAPWGRYPPAVRDWVQELLALPTDAPPAQWMDLHPAEKRWIRYFTGTYLVDQAMKATGKSSAELVTVPTAEVIRLAQTGPPKQ